MAKKNLRPAPVLLVILFLGTLAFRLYFSFQSSTFNSDDAYFHLRHIEHIISEKNFLYYDDLSYGGRYVLYPPLFHLVMVLLSFGSVFLLKIIPEILFSSLVFFIFLIAREITKEEWSALAGAFISSFIPVYLTETVNNLSVYSLALPLLFFSFYCSLKLDSRFYLWGFILGIFFLSLTHPLSFVFLLVLVVYFFLLAGGVLSPSKLKREALLFSLFLIFLLNFIVYKKAFFAYGANVLWQNAPLNIFTDAFRSFTLFDLVFSVGLLPLVLGVFGVFYGVSREKTKVVYLFSSFILSVFILLYFRLLTIRLGLLLFGLALSILAAFALHVFFIYLNKTHFALFKRFFVFVFLILLFSLSFLPSFQAVRRLEGVDPTVIADLEWARLSLPHDTIILGNAHEGNLIASIAQRRTVIDNNFLLAPSPEERLQDVHRIYGGWSSVQAFELLHKYSVDFIYLSEETKELYGISDLKYVNDTLCLKREGNYYAVLC